MRPMTVNVGTPYPLYIGRGALASLGERIGEAFPGAQAAVISDTTVFAHWGRQVMERLALAGVEARAVTLPPGEESKSLPVLCGLYEKMAAMEMTRSDVVVALGGGVMGDLAGVLAATYLRGVPLVQAPTTLLAQVDSSIGGKTAVNLPAGKNLVGAFYHPRLAVIDPAVLDTLDDGNFAAGMAEVIKTACLFDEPLFSLLEAHPGRAAVMPVMDEVITRCCDWKRRVVEADERDTGQRMLLNLGHTLAHALEKCGRPPLAHGQAVAAGMAHILAAAEERGLTRPGTAARLRALLAAFDLPTGLPENVDPAALMEFMARDKKILGGRLNLVLVRRIGEGYIHPMDPAALPEFIGAAPFGEERP